MKAFHAYDIRGIYNEDFNKSDVYKIGFFLPVLLDTNKILVGRDVRVSSPEIYEYLVKGITDAGADVHNLGLSTTPMTYFGTAKYDFKASVQITASHNPKIYNGLKISREKALPVGYANGLQELERMIQEDEINKALVKGKVVDMDIKTEYLDFLRQYLGDMESLKVGIDCSNGMAGLLIKDIYGTQPEYIFDELDGTFPNHEANPLIPENIVDIQNLVKEKQLDVGAIFDGDADRVMFVDERGQFVAPDLIIALLGLYFFEEKKQKGLVLQDIRSSKSVSEYLEKYNTEIFTWKVGRANAANKLHEKDGLYGGELAGHYYFRDFYYSDSGLLASIIVLRILGNLKKQGIKFSDIISEISKYKNSGEINFKINKKQEAIDEVVKHFSNIKKPDKIIDFDGYRLEYPDWWFNIRPSNTEPYLRLIVEANSETLLAEKVDEITKIIKQVENN